MRMKKLRGPHEEVDAVRELPDRDPAGQPSKDLEDRFDAGAEVTRKRSRLPVWRTAASRSRSSPAARSEELIRQGRHGFGFAGEKIEAAGGSCELTTG